VLGNLTSPAGFLGQQMGDSGPHGRVLHLQISNDRARFMTQMHPWIISFVDWQVNGAAFASYFFSGSYAD
jgi:hypothetical protein